MQARENLALKLLPPMLLAIGMLGVSLGAVHAPFVITGAVLGATVLAVALTAPFALVALMLMIGPVDLSFLTGGFKALLPQMGGLDMNGIRLVAATAGFMAYVMFQPRSRAAALGPLSRVWVVFLIFAGATLITSLDPTEGARLLLKLTYPLLTFLIVIGVADSRERIWKLTRYTLAAALLLTVVVSPLIALNGGYHVEGEILRVQGLQGDNPFAFYVTAMLLIVFSRFILRMQLRYLLFSVVLILWIALTGTRIAALASMLGMSVIGLLSALASRSQRALVATLCVAAIMAVLVLPTVLARSFGVVPSLGELFQLMRNPLLLYGTINWNGRDLLWAILWGAFSASPLLGLGLGSSSAVIRETFPNQNIKVAHNEYLRLATDTGMLGVLLFATAVIVWLVAAVRLSRRGDRAVREFAFPAAAAIIAWAVISATDNAFDYYTNFTHYIGFMMAGAVVMDRYGEESPTAEA